MRSSALREKHCLNRLCGAYHPGVGLHPIIEELERELTESGYDPRAYSLTGGSYEDRYCLSPEPGGEWAVYFSERGGRHGEKRFTTPEDAAVNLRDRLAADPTTRV